MIDKHSSIHKYIDKTIWKLALDEHAYPTFFHKFRNPNMTKRKEQLLVLYRIIINYERYSRNMIKPHAPKIILFYHGNFLENHSLNLASTY